MHETSARGWYTGKTQRDRVEREVGAGIGMGNTCNSMADSCQCMTKKTVQYCKVISLQLIKINGKKKILFLPGNRSPVLFFPFSEQISVLKEVHSFIW